MTRLHGNTTLEMIVVRELEMNPDDKIVDK